MPSKPNKLFKLKDCIGLTWDKVNPVAEYICDFCGSEIYTDGHFRGSTNRAAAVLLACKKCGIAAGLVTKCLKS